MESSIITATQQFVQMTLSQDTSGHDWWHVYRVWKMAKYIAQKEQADVFIVELAALLHDIADWKFHQGNLEAGPVVAREWLEQQAVAEDKIEQVCEIIRRITFKGADTAIELLSLEGKIVQDADRLDAIGAIGIGRTFAYGGYQRRPMHLPDIKPMLHKTFEEYKTNQGTTINHFYEKLLLLKDRMNTDTAKYLAAQRHAMMEEFLRQFLSEWDSDYSKDLY